MNFQKAQKYGSHGRMALVGPAGAGKTYTGLRVLSAMCEKIAVVDTEHGSASKYADIFDFDVLELESFDPALYIEAIQSAQRAGYDGLLIDSLSHAWIGKDGALEMKDKASQRSGENSFTAWRHVTPIHTRLIDEMLGCKMHLIVSMRSKTEYVIEENAKGQKVPRKIGLQPIQREGMEFEFDVVGDMDQMNVLSITKSRCPAMSGQMYTRPGEDVAEVFSAWLDGEEAPEKPKVKPTGDMGIAGKKRFLAKVEEWMDALGDRFNEILEKDFELVAGDMAKITDKELVAEIHEAMEAAIEAKIAVENNGESGDDDFHKQLDKEEARAA